jgi:hypothetical protein
VNARHSGISQRAQYSCRVRLRVPQVLRWAETPSPGVEELDDGNTGSHLQPQECRGQIGQPGAHLVP